jgi:hypothetical protein
VSTGVSAVPQGNRLLQLLGREPRDALSRDPMRCLQIPELRGTFDPEGGDLLSRVAPPGRLVWKIRRYAELLCAHVGVPDLDVAADVSADVVLPPAEMPHQPSDDVRVGRWAVVQLLVRRAIRCQLYLVGGALEKPTMTWLTPTCSTSIPALSLWLLCSPSCGCVPGYFCELTGTRATVLRHVGLGAAK